MKSGTLSIQAKNSGGHQLPNIFSTTRRRFWQDSAGTDGLSGQERVRVARPAFVFHAPLSASSISDRFRRSSSSDENHLSCPGLWRLFGDLFTQSLRGQSCSSNKIVEHNASMRAVRWCTLNARLVGHIRPRVFV